MRRRPRLILILPALVLIAAAGCTKVKLINESEVIPFETVRHDDPSLMKGREKVVQRGEQGIKTIVYEDRYSWGGQVKRKRVKVVTVYKPTPEVVNIGTKKVLTISVSGGSGAFEINIAAAARVPQYVDGRLRLTNAAVLTGTIKNVGSKPAKTGGATDLVLLSPALKGGLTVLPTAPVAALGPGQTVSVTWAASLRGAPPAAAPAAAAIEQMKVTARAFIGPKNRIMGEVKSLSELPST